MSTALRQRVKSDRGFSMIELVVVVLIIGTLAAIALPAFIGQRPKGQDAATKSDLRNAVSQVESCFANTEDYTAAECVAAASFEGVLMTPISPTTGYVVTKTSDSGNWFSFKHDGALGDERTCAPLGTEKGGCARGRTW